MTGPFRFTTPATSAQASASGANALTVTINAVGDSSLLIYGVDLSYNTSGSRQAVRIETGGSIVWSQFVRDQWSWNFEPHPLIMTRNQSLQVIADQPAGTNDGRLAVRYGYERT